MSVNCGQLKSNEEREVMVRQVNLAAAFHDHISCTKISQHSIATSICGLQTSVADIGDPQNVTIGSELSAPFESDHIYATESKSFNDNSLSTNGCVLRANSLFGNSLSDERNQISKLTEMLLGQLDLIQHQQEQLLKKDRQLQGLKQDREALCLRLEKMEKRIAVLTAKVANNNNNANVVNNSNNTPNNSISTNSININTINLNRNNVNSQSSSNTIETDCDQSGSDTIVEENNSVVGLLTDPSLFAKLYSNSSVNSSVNKSTITSKSKPINTTSGDTTNTDNEDNSVTPVKIKIEPQEDEELVAKPEPTATTSCTAVRKGRKRVPEVVAMTPSTTISTPNRKRSKTSNNSDVAVNDIKKEIISSKETSCDSLSTLSTTNNTINKTLNNIKKKVVKQKSETSSKGETTQASSSYLNLKNISLIRDVLLTSKPYSIVVNSSHSPLELSLKDFCDADDSVDSKPNCEDKSRSLEMIEVPKFRLHPVSSCYSLEGTEVCVLFVSYLSPLCLPFKQIFNLILFNST